MCDMHCRGEWSCVGRTAVDSPMLTVVHVMAVISGPRLKKTRCSVVRCNFYISGVTPGLTKQRISFLTVLLTMKAVGQISISRQPGALFLT